MKHVKTLNKIQKLQYKVDNFKFKFEKQDMLLNLFGMIETNRPTISSKKKLEKLKIKLEKLKSDSKELLIEEKIRVLIRPIVRKIV